MSKEVKSNFGYIVKVGNGYLNINEIYHIGGNSISLNVRLARKYDNYVDAKKSSGRIWR
ncbi:hypothetical protein [Listeria rocourtiae]|uniref:hypothetical protein n=1 Tax=Listeria rocourtiae TaxID=647910 RepID=UPI00131F000C|nr:hypothetical protein [Listeria rocourtiae]